MDRSQTQGGRRSARSAPCGLGLLAALLCALSVAQGAHLLQPDGALTVPSQALAVEVTAADGRIALSNVRLHGGKISVRYWPQPRAAAAGEPSSVSGGTALDWEQLWDQAGPAGGDRSYSLAADLPQGVNLADVGTVAAFCEGCGGFSGSLGTTALAGSRARGSGALGTVVFIFSGAQLPDAANRSGQSSRRRLQQGLPGQAAPTPLGDCSFPVPGTNDQLLGFQGCQAVPLQPSALYNVYYTLEPNNTSGGTVWKGALHVDVNKVGGNFSGFGFPQFPATMLGTDAVIVKDCPACPTGASVDGYQLKGYTPDANIAGSYPLTDKAAYKLPDGTLLATFTAQRPEPPSQLLASPFNFVYSIGPVDQNDGLLPHLGATLPFGGNAMNLQAGYAGTDGAAAGAPSPSAEAVAPLPAAAPPSYSAAAGAPAPPSRMALTTPGTDLSAPAAGSGSNASNCVMSLGGEAVSFAACAPLENIAPGFVVMWNLTSEGANASVLTLGLRAPASGWVAVGFPDTPKFMVPSTAMILKTCSGCASGAQIQDYFLAGRLPSLVQPPGKLPVSDPSASAQGGTMAGTIQIKLDSAAAANPAFPINCAAGNLDSSGGLLQHYMTGSTTLNLASGTSTGVQGEPAHVTRMKNAHGWLMAIGWGVLIPLGILTARHAKQWDPLWFHIHRAVQVLGLSCALAAFIMIFYAVKDATGTTVSAYKTHRSLGITAMSLGLFQLLALGYRPHKGTRLRPYWEFVHHWVGRAAAVIAVANIYEGIINVRHLGTWATATYSTIFALIVAAGIGLDLWKLLGKGRQPGGTGAGAGAAGSRPPPSALKGDDTFLKRPANGGGSAASSTATGLGKKGTDDGV